MKTTFSQGVAFYAPIQRHFFILFILLLSGFQTYSAKAQYVYGPKALALTQLSQDHQAEASVGLGRGIETMAAYSFAPQYFAFSQLGIYDGARNRDKSKSLIGDHYNGWAKDYIWRTGVGFYQLTPQFAVNRWEMLLGAGMGVFQREIDLTSDRGLYTFSRSESQHLFAQVNASMVDHEDMFTLGMRLSYMKIRMTEMQSWTKPETRNMADLGKVNAMALDITTTFRQRLGDDLKLQLQLGLSNPLWASGPEDGFKPKIDPKKNSTQPDPVLKPRLIGSLQVVYRFEVPRLFKSRGSR